MLPVDRLARVLLPSFFHSHCPTPSIRFPSCSPCSLCRCSSLERSTLDKTRHAKLVSNALSSRLIGSPRFEFGSEREMRSLFRALLREFSVPSLNSSGSSNATPSGTSASNRALGEKRDRLAIKTQVPLTTVSKRFWTIGGVFTIGGISRREHGRIDTPDRSRSARLFRMIDQESPNRGRS